MRHFFLTNDARFEDIGFIDLETGFTDARIDEKGYPAQCVSPQRVKKHFTYHIFHAHAA